MSEEDLFEKAGGLEGVSSMVDHFYKRILADAELAPFFKDVPMEKLHRMQTEFFSAALGGPVVYSGRPIREVHAGLGITKHHLQLFVEHFLETVKELKLDENAVNAIYSRIALYADDLTGETTVDG
ncbi:MAG: group 1 truncated hemoglobin [Akkermansiaceae bacterium]|nr:group 1 truncated hemoglobin [Akkermansiaceae bacterium]NNM29120.1 group 1 truncated hemoglobin [Akkermansiaceae bacterium]